MAETRLITPPYEPPRIERVLTPEDLTYEILYAGHTPVSIGDEPDI